MDMSKGSFKTVIVIAFLVSASLSLPMLVSAEDSKDYSTNQVGGSGMFSNPNQLWGGMGAAMNMFGQFGFAGAVLGKVLEIVFMQGLDISTRETLPGVFMLNASVEESHTENETYSDADHEYFWIPEFYYKNSNITKPPHNGDPYCVINKSGSVNYTFTMGAAVTIILWDSDYSLINALQRVIDFGREMYESIERLQQTGAPQQQVENEMVRLAGKAVEVIAYLLIHINDIINGDELLMMNPISWQTLEVETGADFTLNKTWYFSNGTAWDNPLPKEWVNGLNWSDIADSLKDPYMKFLLSPDEAGVLKNTWTHFTFDLVQLWIKNFHIVIDAAEIIDMLTGMVEGAGGQVGPYTAQDGGNPFADTNLAEIFEGCDIEFYLFTHHLTGAFLYNDANGDKKISVEYGPVINRTTNETIIVDGNPVMVPRTTEVSHRLMLGEVKKFLFVEPHITSVDGQQQVSWGLNMTDLEIAAVPIGMSPEDYIGTVPVEELDFAYFGFSFIPNITATLEKDDGTVMNLASGRVKLDQFFAPWNDADGVPNANGDIGTNDLSIIYFSSVLHVHLNLTIDEVSQEKLLAYDDDEELLTSDDYNSTDHQLYIGDYMLGIANTPFVDIAGPYYEVGVTRATAAKYQASTSLIPLALFEAGVESFQTHVNEDDVTNSFTSETYLNVEANALLYSVNYWAFNGTGQGIWHDPTFSVYMTWEQTQITAVLLLLGGITLVGVATILITRKKNKAIR